MQFVDFKEIPAGNSSGDEQDLFELFARDFLECLGYSIIVQPGRGADRGKDIVVEEKVETTNSSVTMKWLVSCKHYAGSGRAVKETDEENLTNRVENHKCDGFMCFYSTNSTSGLSDALSGRRESFFLEMYDRTAIERHLTTNRRLTDIFRQYFPKSDIKFHQNGGYRLRNLSYPTVKYRQISNPLQSRPRGQINVTPFVEIVGEEILEVVSWSIREPQYTHTVFDKLLASGKTNGLYLDTENQLNAFTLPAKSHRGDDFLRLSLSVACKQGTFTVDTDVTLCDLGFFPTAIQVKMKDRSIYAATYNRKGERINEQLFI